MERRDIIEITGQGLILRNIKWYLKMLEVAGFYITGFKRVDICLDIKINTDYACRRIFLPALEEKGKTYLPIIKKGKYETLQI